MSSSSAREGTAAWERRRGALLTGQLSRLESGHPPGSGSGQAPPCRRKSREGPCEDQSGRKETAVSECLVASEGEARRPAGGVSRTPAPLTRASAMRPKAAVQARAANLSHLGVRLVSHLDFQEALVRARVASQAGQVLQQRRLARTRHALQKHRHVKRQRHGDAAEVGHGRRRRHKGAAGGRGCSFCLALANKRQDHAADIDGRRAQIAAGDAQLSGARVVGGCRAGRRQVLMRRRRRRSLRWRLTRDGSGQQRRGVHTAWQQAAAAGGHATAAR